MKPWEKCSIYLKFYSFLVEGEERVAKQTFPVYDLYRNEIQLKG